MTVFVDSGGWLSVLIATDQHHAAGSRDFRAMRAAGARLVTTDYVLDEVATRLRYDAGHPQAAGFLRLVRDAAGAGALNIRRIDERLWDQAEAIFLRYSDARLSFTDCTSFALLRAEPADEVFGYDSHFEMMGHVLRPKG